MRTGEAMEVIFLLAGLVLVAVSIAIAVSEIRDRKGTRIVTGRVIGFSSGKYNRPTSPSFHSVAEYVGPNGHTYYVEGAIGSPLNHFTLSGIPSRFWSSLPNPKRPYSSLRCHS
jgi:hypothetical protein